jgi:hypothetical protein
MQKLALVLALLALLLAVPVTAGAQAPAPCAEPVEVVVWTQLEWNRFADGLEANPLPCAEYWISLPPGLVATNLRAAGMFNQIRLHGPQFHPMAEMRLGSASGWYAWVNDQTVVPRRTWYDAGVEFRRRMADRGLDVTKGETWLLNEFNRSTINDTPPADPMDLYYSRADMRALIRGLYEGAPGMPPARGAVEIGINYTHQDMPDAAAYKEELKDFLLDSPFWADMDGRVRWMLKEVYPDARNHGVPDSTRTKRRRQLEQYQFHLVDLAADAPKEASVAKEFLRDTFVAKGSASWATPGPDASGRTAHGWTLFPVEDMLHFVSEQVYAMRYYADAHPKFGPSGRLGFSWQPANNPIPPSIVALPAAEFEAGQDAIAARIGSAIKHAYASPDAPAIDACRPPGSGEQWCNSFVPGAKFTDSWLDFAYWK